MSDRPRVWITGLGLVTAAGIGLDAFRVGIRQRTSPVRAIDRFDATPFRSQVAAQIDDFDPAAFMDHRAVRGMDRFSQFAVAAGRLAMDDAHFEPGRPDGVGAERIGIYLGSALGGVSFAEEQHERFLERGIRSVSPTLALAVFGGAAPANLGIALGVRGPILSTANSCASGAVALGEALHAIQAGTIDAAVAGGVECPLSPLAFGAFDVIRALADHHNDQPEQACRPFDPSAAGSSWGKVPPCWCSRKPKPHGDGAPSRTPSFGATAPRPMPSTWSSPDPTEPMPRARSRLRWPMRATKRPRWTT